MRERIVLFDIARSLCVLEIVGFWHMLDYINCNNIYVRTIGCGITYSVLACFTFISGFFLGQKETSTKKFYYSRLKRFFLPLLLTSLCFLCIGWFDSIQLFIFTITGLSCFIPPQPMTLWYFSMIIIFYFVTPFLLWKSTAKSYKIIVKGIILFAIFLLLFNLKCLDERILMYFPFYVVGILSSKSNILKYCDRNILFIITLVSWSIMIKYNIHTYIIGSIITNTLGIYLLLYCSNKIEKLLPQAQKIFSILAYSSMFAYLFHREVYLFFDILFSKILHLESIPIMIAPVMVILLFTLSYYGQKTYNNFLNKYFK